MGNGKTVLMQYFYQLLSIKKLMTHYQHLIQAVYLDIHQLQNKTKNTYNIIKRIASVYTKKYSVICIDEFEIKDITDAMIIGPLIFELIQNKIFIFITSNIKPDYLYQDVLQRNSFIPIIKEIYNKFEIIHLDSNNDYRLDKVIKTSQRRMFYPINQDTKLAIQQLITDLSKYNPLVPTTLNIFGRIVSFKAANQKMLATDFTELFLRKLGYGDYVNICQKFSIILVENIPIIESNNTDLAVRFINFIDNAYFYKIVLLMSLETEPTNIYQNGHRSEEFKRTISRLYEMNSDSYVNN